MSKKRKRRQIALPSPLVYVEWADSCSTMGWHPVPAGRETSHIVSVGLLVQEDEQQVVISTSQSEHGRYVDYLAIPRASIRCRRKVREVS